jgi:DNA polymerase-3 subunit alpha
LFQSARKGYTLPQFDSCALEDAYDELEILGFPVSMSAFDMLKTNFRGDVMATDLSAHVGQEVRMVGNYITAKHVRTVSGGIMNFGTFVDAHDHFFDTTHFPPTLKQYPFKGAGLYLIKGVVVQDFGFPSIEVECMAKLPIHNDPRG